MKTLIEALTESTQDLKVKYIAQVKQWAKDQFKRDLECLNWNEIKWCEYFNLTPRLANYRGEPITYDPKRKLVGSEFWTLPDGFYNTKNYSKMDRMRNAARNAERVGVDVYVKKEVAKGESHYKYSIEKLAERLVKKGIANDRGADVKIESGWVGVNLELVITVDKIRVKAWTIVAEGIVQRPHYRYLVK